MGHRFLTFLGIAAIACTAVFIAETPVAGQQASATASSTAAANTWKPGRTPWGDPDLAGIYSNSDESGIPLERPAQFEGRRLEDVTAKELEELRVARRNATAAATPSIGPSSCTSSSATCGRTSSPSSRAASPLPVCPTTWTTPVASSPAARAGRSRALSSTSSNRIVPMLIAP